MEVSSDQHGIGPVREGKGQAVDHLVLGGLNPSGSSGKMHLCRLTLACLVASSYFGHLFTGACLVPLRFLEQL